MTHPPRHPASGVERRARRMFFAAVLLCVFCYGFLAGKFKWFPYALLREAATAAQDLRHHWGAYFSGEPSRLLSPRRDQPFGVSRVDRGAMAAGMTLMSSYFDGAYVLVLLRDDGTIFHRWPLRYTEIFSDEEIRGFGHPVRLTWVAAIMGAVLLEDGSVVFTFTTGGVAKLDKCGALVWKSVQNTHHTIVMGEDGSFWLPGTRRTFAAGEPIDIPGLSAPFDEESIVHLDRNGALLEEVSIPRLMLANGLHGVLFANTGGSAIRNLSPDYTHLNKVDVLTARMAPAFPMFRAGDLLLSMRHLNLVMVVEPGTWRVKWHQIGPWLRQHDSEFRADGKISVFDNRTDDADGHSFGGSRIVAIDPATQALTTVYAGSANDPFYTNVAGEHVYLSNSNLLISETMAGRIFEVDPRGKVVWQFVNGYDSARVVAETNAYSRPAPEFLNRIDWRCHE